MKEGEESSCERRSSKVLEKLVQLSNKEAGSSNPSFTHTHKKLRIFVA